MNAPSPRPSSSGSELTLDPADAREWDELRALGHRMLDDMLDYLRTVRDRPAWRPVPAAVRARLAEPVPLGATPAAAVYEQFTRDILPYPTGNLHPRFWGWVIGTGTPLAMLADMLASGMNPQVAEFDDAPAVVENQVIGWLVQLLGLPAGTHGLLVSGGSMANFVGLAVARNARAGFDVRDRGLQRGEPDLPRLLVYASTETHSSVRKAVELLGLGNQALRRIPVASNYTIDVAALRRAIAADRAAGHRPICVVGNAGTVNTGATDDLPALAGLCREEGLWLHVDGAFGALAVISPTLRPLVRGIEQADSVAFDLHKWMYLPYEVGCTLVRDQAAHRATFAVTPAYLAAFDRGIAAGGFPFAERGVQLSRGFRALKVWMSIKAHGVEAFARLIEQNVQQAAYLVGRIAAHPRLELLAPAPLNVVCFRYTAPGLGDAALNALNQEILLRIQESGLAVPSHTELGGRFAIRVAITNHRSRREDFDLLAQAVVETGDALRGD
jgi:glutamate/tyrosine decarboxylase-like PLP-dependent enzyme